MKIFFVVLIGLSSFIYGDFNKQNGVVTDSFTRLQWQDDYSDNEEEIKSAPWIETFAYCENLTLAGQNDWRLPNINELSSIIDFTRKSPALNPIFEYIVPHGFYWSSTTIAGYSGNVWIVYFSNGRQGNYYKSDSLYVRCVRAGQ